MSNYDDDHEILRDFRTLSESEFVNKHGKLVRKTIPHTSVLKFLREMPELVVVEEESMELGRTYPSLKAWGDFSRIMDAGDLWGNEALMTVVLRRCCGKICAMMFPKFYTEEWLKKTES